jgi:tetratricopeptide (TPR) repeat protein
MEKVAFEPLLRKINEANGSEAPDMIDAIETRLLVVRNLLKADRVEEALQELTVLLNRNPESGKVQAMYGHILYRYFGQYDAAEEAFRKAMRINGTFHELYIDYANLLFDAAKYTEMVAVLNKALEVPLIRKDQIYVLFGRLYERQENWDEAIEYYSKAALFTLSNQDLEIYLSERQRVLRKREI